MKGSYRLRPRKSHVAINKSDERNKSNERNKSDDGPERKACIIRNKSHLVLSVAKLSQIHSLVKSTLEEKMDVVFYSSMLDSFMIPWVAVMSDCADDFSSNRTQYKIEFKINTTMLYDSNYLIENFNMVISYSNKSDGKHPVPAEYITIVQYESDELLSLDLTISAHLVYDINITDQTFTPWDCTTGLFDKQSSTSIYLSFTYGKKRYTFDSPMILCTTNQMREVRTFLTQLNDDLFVQKYNDFFSWGTNVVVSTKPSNGSNHMEDLNDANINYMFVRPSSYLTESIEYFDRINWNLMFRPQSNRLTVF